MIRTKSGRPNVTQDVVSDLGHENIPKTAVAKAVEKTINEPVNALIDPK